MRFFRREQSSLPPEPERSHPLALPRALAREWLSQFTLPHHSGDPAVEQWLTTLSGLDAAAVMARVVDTPGEVVDAAVITLLDRAGAAISDSSSEFSTVGDVGQILSRIVRNGHGTGFEGGDLAEAHAHFLVGVGWHIARPGTARAGYDMARALYESKNLGVPSLLASLGSAATSVEARRENDFSMLREQLTLLRARAQDVALRLDPAITRHEEALRLVNRARTGDPLVELPVDLRDETIGMLRSAVRDSVDDPPAAIRMARIVDKFEPQTVTNSCMAELAAALSSARRFADVVSICEELLAGDRTREGDSTEAIARTLARAYAELNRWPDAQALLVAHLHRPPDRSDIQILELLFYLAHYVGQVADAQHWRDVIVSVDPSADPLRGMPKPPDEPSSPVELLARVHDGEMQIDARLLELPELLVAAHMAAAVVIASPNPGEVLQELLTDKPELGTAVAKLLGVRQLTPEQAQARRHLDQAERYFVANDMVAAQQEYRQALQYDPDLVEAITYLGDTWYRLGKYHLAQAYFEESIATRESAQAYRFLGDAIRHGGHGAYGTRRARRCYEQALRIDPNYRGAQVALANLDEATASPLGPAAPQDLSNSAGTTGPSVGMLAAGLFAAKGEPATAGSDPGPSPTGPPAARPRLLSSGADGGRDGEGVGDRLLAAMANRDAGHPIVLAQHDDGRFEQWLATAEPDAIAATIMMMQVLAFQYEMKDRNFERTRFWVNREVQAASALPESFGPAQARAGLGRHRLLGDALSALADVRRTEGKLPDARALLERSIDLLAQEQEARSAAGLPPEAEFDILFGMTNRRKHVLIKLADLCSEMGDEAAATAHYAAASFEGADHPSLEARVNELMRAAAQYQDLGDDNQALGLLQHALFLTEDEDVSPVTPRLLATTLNALGEAHQRHGLLRTALGYFQRARELNETTGNAHRLTYDHLAIAGVLRAGPRLAKGPEDDALHHLETALKYCSTPVSETGDLTWADSDGSHYRITAPNRAWRVLLDLGRLLRETGDGPRSVVFLSLAVSLTEVVLAGLAEDNQRIAVQSRQITAFADLVEACVQLAAERTPQASEYAARAWAASEAMRARTFLHALGETRLAAPAGVPADLLANEDALLTRRRELGRSASTDVATWERYRETTSELNALWAQMLAVAPEASGYVELRQAQPAEPVEVAELLTDPSGRSVVLATLVPLGEERVAVMALRHGDAAPTIESRPVDVRRMIQFIRQNFGSAGRVRQLAKSPQVLRQELAAIPELLTAVTAPEELLVVCPFQELHHVPIGALVHNGRPMLERNPISLLPSASVLRAMRSVVRQEPAEPAAVLGDPTGDLPGARAEAVALGQRLGARPLLGPEATVEALRGALTRAGLVHVAAHAMFNSEDPLGSGIVLSDGVLSARDILALQTPSLAHATLSACETGLSQTNAADDLIGLSRAFIFAGAQSLLVSLWRVLDEPTLDIMTCFYDALTRGSSKVDALREATLEVRNRQGHDHIDRWAAFQLVGDWR